MPQILREWKITVLPSGPETIGRFSRGPGVVEWRFKLEARSGWGSVETVEIAQSKRRVVGLTAEETVLFLDEAKRVLAELRRLVLQTRMEEYTSCAVTPR
jgi:hypothetical protein